MSFLHAIGKFANNLGFDGLLVVAGLLNETSATNVFKKPKHYQEAYRAHLNLWELLEASRFQYFLKYMEAKDPGALDQ